MYLKNWDRMGATELREKQGAMLHRFLKTQVLKYSPFYRELFEREGLTADDIRSVDDLRKIPFSSKIDIAPSREDPARPRRFILQPDPETYGSTISLGKKLALLRDRLMTGRKMVDLVYDEYLPVFFIATTGRTALPTPFVYTTRDLGFFRKAAYRAFQVGGIRRGEDFLINAFPYAPHLAFWLVYQGGVQTGTPVFHTGGGRVLGSEAIIGAIERLKATILIGIPGYVYHLLRLASERGCDYSKIRMVALGAERVTIGLKRRLRELLESMGAKEPVILGTYGFTEARTAWLECPTEHSITDSTGYHLYPDMEIFEIVDPDTGEPVGDGEPGEIVYTPLDWRGSVVLRYRTGDYARGGITLKKCPACGRMVPRLTTDITRLSDRSELRLAKVKGTLVDFNEFFPILTELEGVVEWQIEITKRNEDPHELDEIHVHMAVTSGCDQAVLLRDLKVKIQQRMELSPAQVYFRSAAEMAERLAIDVSPKEKRIIDRRPELLSKGGDE